MQKKGLTPVTPPFSRFLKYAPPVIEMEAGFAIAKADLGEGEIVSSVIPAGDYAKTRHLGSYDLLAPAYESLHKWIDTNKKQPNGAPLEVYLNSPSEVKPDELKTEIYYPFK